VLQIGEEPVLGYRLRNRLGAGSFGEVWEAAGPNGQTVALKFIDSHRRDCSLIRAEIRLLQSVSGLGHANLIKLLGVYASSHYFVLCLEKADGNLEELRLAYREVTGGNIPAEDLLDLLEQVACGLDFIAGLKLPGFNLSSSGLQHCDIKPKNLLLLGEVVKIADFGLCAALGEQTHKQGCRGTYPYAPPELYRGRAAPTTDQYSLAVTYCDLVGGERVLSGAAYGGAAIAAQLDLGPIGHEQREVLMRALSNDPTRRWPSCQAFVGALREAIRSQPTSKPRRGTKSRTGIPRPTVPV
jgi:serine/threonine protein kinase